ncbi:MAG: hypothetical protein FWF44_02500 [Defluviitaleaceae bacterium]|nr:hypothetical protein [Defluviitaleaceae bacterium]
MMTSRQRVLTALGHMQPDRVPFSLGFGVNEPALSDLQHYLGHTSRRQTYDWLYGHVDLRWISPDYIGPRAMGEDAKSIWGIEYKMMSYGRGSYNEISRHPLAEAEDISDLDSYVWPSADWFRYDNIPEKIRGINHGGEYAIVAGVANIFETAWGLTGFERMLGGLLAEPEFFYELMRRITDFNIAYYTKMLQAADGKIDIVFPADDVGQQEGPLMSVHTWESMIKPHHERQIKAFKEYGVKIMYHTDGAVMEFIPGLLDMGIDVLEALQFDAKGMDPRVMKEKYGGRLCFHGGVSIQSTLPFGTPEQVREETRERVRVLGENGGYILAPSHMIQAGTPPENIMAMLGEIG